MPSKISTIYSCSNCDAQFLKWSGRCLSCGKWGTLQVQMIEEKTKDHGNKPQVIPADLIDLQNLKAEDSARIKTGIGEVDRVLGGGLMPGSMILLSGEPGIGKSTIVAQIADAIGRQYDTIYASGEESAYQVKARFDRLHIKTDKIKFLTETRIEKTLAAIEQYKPSLAIIDSIQTVYTAEIDSEPGNLNQIRASAAKLLEVCKHTNVAAIIVGHITKDGQIAGPKSLEHLVDTVIYLEVEKNNDFRILRATKNRFGSVNEIGLFTMKENGFQEVINPSAFFLDTSHDNISGSAISSVIEGTRPFLVEIQALTTKTVFGYPQRKSSGFDLGRLIVLIAVLTKRTKINLSNQDVILNIVGGMRINDPALDLSVCLAITASLLDQAIDRKTLILGEVGLGGEVRNIKNMEQRLNEAAKLGFTKAIIPKVKINSDKLKLVPVNDLSEAIKTFIN